ncbi:preprotein translocase secE subunit (nucleomorph) [Chroomonas mesostigmatica CCMP1168]|uniref:Preprotein translocase secE subunit n=1 Tax=Chroomonas mesostigmatica CCMP1168 TaxID=1195612 RepID=J7GAI8_9CRYP|nr:preprotein translocase secE subunit [Chroomonas mesostigmatica CCMP1168]|mmetsp:Transcript_66059/g.162611  ORF Transcript_66059/g.162611 Transcript_66059/m.162611 type:complete len:134 (+) Transcript_66059:1253-1654(+)
MAFINLIYTFGINKKSEIKKNLCKEENKIFFNKKIKKESFIKLSSPLNEKKNDSMQKEDKPTDKDENYFSEIFFLDFIKEVRNEIKMVEWPTLNRLFRQFVIVVVSLVFSSLMVYSVDGLFASASKLLFEGKY